MTVKVKSYLKRPKKGIRPRTAAVPWNVPDLCKAYGWPTGLPIGGTIAIVELGGGWNQADVSQFCSSNNVPLPSITDVSVDGTTNSPGNDADGEVALDIQVAAAAYSVATGQAAKIRMYWSQDIAAAVRAAAKDGCDVCSISWGADESNWGAGPAQDMEAAAAEALAAGMVVFAAAGDNDSSDGDKTPANVDLPAGCPSVVGCGGTLKTTTSESVWNDSPGNPSGGGTGGGYSTLFPAQAWQIGAPTAPSGLGRMVPDVAAVADPTTGYNIVLNGQVEPVGGTSAVAPLYAGLFAAIGTKLGNVLPTLWQNAADFADVTIGDNGVYHAQRGADPCTGLGVPIGAQIAALFAKIPPPPSGPNPVKSQQLAKAQAAVVAALADLPACSTLKDEQKAASDALAALDGWS